MITEAWYDRGSGGFWLSYEAIPEAHRKSPGRIVRMMVADDGNCEGCDGACFSCPAREEEQRREARGYK